MEIANLLSTCKGMQQDVEGTFPIAVEILLKPNNENHRQEAYSPSKKKKIWYTYARLKNGRNDVMILFITMTKFLPL